MLRLKKDLRRLKKVFPSEGPVSFLLEQLWASPCWKESSERASNQSGVN